MATADVIVIHRYNLTNFIIVTFNYEWKRWTSPLSGSRTIHENLTYLSAAKLLPTQEKLNYQESFTVYLRQKIAALLCDAGWLSAQQHSSYFHRCWRGTCCSRTGGESTRWQEDRGKERSRRGRARRGPQEKDCLNMVMQQDHYHLWKGKGFSDCFIDVG